MILLVPAYQPDRRLIRLLDALPTALLPAGAGARGVTDPEPVITEVIVVDDGSGTAYAEIFSAAAAAGARVLTHATNRGKGAALRTGFEWIMANRAGQDVVCADSDGQHLPADILAVAAALHPGDPQAGPDIVLGCRRFTGTVPARSRVGNEFSRHLVRLVSGLNVPDTQTGLRGYPHRSLAWACGIEGDRFEYELRMLLAASRAGLTVDWVEIDTVYLAGNESSHFRPVRDSVRVLAPVAAFVASSLLGFVVDFVAMAALFAATGHIALSVIGARCLSLTVNYTANRRLVFASRESARRTLPRYLALAVVLLAANVFLVQTLSAVLPVLVAKLLTEILLFVMSFAVQHTLVFAGPHAPARHARGERVPLALSR
ncbi:MAG: GtrA family protein [Actinomycetales bacterium]